MKRRIVRRDVAVSVDLVADVHPVLRRVYAARGVRCGDDIDHQLAHMLAPIGLGGMQRACDLLESAIRDGTRIVVVGDFDADGATGTAVAVRGLRMLGGGEVHYAVPNRFRHGYGLSPGLVDELLPLRPRLLVTVDNGIVAHAGVAAAKQHGIDVIVTDHHLPAATLPAADAIVNPNLREAQRCAHVVQDSGVASPPGTAHSLCRSCASDLQANRDFGSRALAGVGVMFYVLLALRARLFPRAGAEGENRPTAAAGPVARVRRPDLSSLLDLVAVGTVADLVPLDRNNRILVDAGLRRIRAGRACAGVRALLDVAGADFSRTLAGDLGFRVAPRINAAGRLSDMSLGIECLLSDDETEARAYADTLDAINLERRQLQVEMVGQAQRIVDQWADSEARCGLPFGLVLFDPQWHPGVVGLIASKLRESLHRPVFACALDGNDGGNEAVNGGAESAQVKASGRSIPGLHLRDALADVDARYPGLIGRFGGHAMAAGLTLARDRIETFASAFDSVVRERVAPESLDAVILSDGELAESELTLDLAERLRDAGPWGQAFPEPVFDGLFVLETWKVVGDHHVRMQLRCGDAGARLQAIMFNGFEGVAPPTRFRAAYELGVNEWNGRRSLQLLIRHMEPA